jgi:hypothetical protein
MFLKNHDIGPRPVTVFSGEKQIGELGVIEANGEWRDEKPLRPFRRNPTAAVSPSPTPPPLTEVGLSKIASLAFPDFGGILGFHTVEDERSELISRQKVSSNLHT